MMASSSEPIPVTREEERLTQLLTDHYVQAEEMSAKVRQLSNKIDLYNAAAAKWKEEGLRIPPADDEKKRAEFFNKCNEIRSQEPKGPEECVITSGPLLRLVTI